jgi:hypothetical protein
MRADDGTCLAGGFATTAFVGYDDNGIYVEVSVRCETCGTALVFDAPFTNGSSRELGVADAFAKVLNVPVARFATDADQPGHAAAVARAEAQASGQAAAMRFTPDDEPATVTLEHGVDVVDGAIRHEIRARVRAETEGAERLGHGLIHIRGVAVPHGPTAEQVETIEQDDQEYHTDGTVGEGDA